LPGGGKIFRQSPRIAALLQLMDYIVSNTIALLFGQTLAQSSDQFSSAA
jgi:hypothetical protein